MTNTKKIFSTTGKPLLSARAAAKRLSCAPDYVGKLCREGKLVGIRENNTWFVDPNSVVAFEQVRAAAKIERARELSEARKQESKTYQQANSLSNTDFFKDVIKSFDVSKYGFRQIAGAILASLMLGALVFGSNGVLGSFKAFNSASLAASIAQVESPFFGTGAQISIGNVGSLFSGLFGGWFGSSGTALVQVPVPAIETHSFPLESATTTGSAVPVKNNTVAQLSQPTTVIQNTYPIRERTVERVVTQSGITQELLNNALQELGNSIRSELYSSLGSLSSLPASGGVQNSIALSQHITKLSGVTISNGTVNGLSGLTDADIPDNITASGYVPLSGYTTGDIVYANSSGTLTTLPIGSTGRVLKVSGGVPVWGIETGGGGGGSWATTTDALAVYPADPTQVVLVGNSATTTTGNIFEVTGSALFRNALVAYETITGPRFVATSTIASIFPYASSTALTVSGIGYFGTASTSNLTVSNLPSSLLTTNSSGAVVATTSLGAAYGGTGLAALPSYGQILVGNASGGYTLTATSSLGIVSSGGSSFSTTSADYWSSLGLGFSTTSAAYWSSVNNFSGFSTTSADYYVNASTTIPKTYSNNTFAGGNIFNGTFTLGSYNGPLQANSGVVSATSSIGVLYGGTGLTTAPTYGKVLVGNASGGYTLMATSTLGLGGGGGSGVWGGITGTLSDQTDLQSALDAKLSLASWYATTTDGLAQGLTNKYYSNSLFATSLAGTTTNALPEGSTNLYYTNGRVQTYLDTLSKGYFFATSSADYWSTTKNFAGFSTTSAQYFASQFGQWQVAGGALIPTSTLGIIVNASSTIGNGTQTGGLTISGGATTTGNASIAGTLKVGDDTAFTDTAVPNTLGLYGLADSTIGSLQLGNGGGIISGYNGKIGIGVTNPADKLQVGDGSSDIRLSVMSNSTNQFTAKNASGNSFKYGATADTIPNGVISNNDGTAVLTITHGGSLGIGTTSPYAALSVVGSSGVVANIYTALSTTAASTFVYASTTALTVSGTGYFGTASTSNLTVSGLGGSAGSCLTVTSSGVLTAISCGSGSSFPFTQTAFGAGNSNATSTLIGFTSGIYALASSTIGNGTQAGGLTVSGGATTTGNAYVGGLLTIAGAGTSTIASNISISGDIVPTADNTYSLGTPTNMWKHVYVGPGSLYVNGQKVLSTDGSNNVVVSSDVNQNLVIKTTGTANLELNPSGTGQLLIKSGINVTAGKQLTTTDSSAFLVPFGVAAGNLTVSGNAIAASNLNGGISLTPNGAGNTYVTAGNFGIGTTSPGSKLSVSGNAYISGGLTLGTALPIGSGGTGLSSAPSYGQLLIGDGSGGYTFTSTSTLGISADSIATGTLAVTYGGTGVSSLTGIAVGNGTAPFSSITDSLGLKNVISDETGSGALVFGTSPTLSAPTVTGLLSVQNSSTTLSSVFGKAYFGGTATSSFDSAGALTLASALASGSGGTGISSVSAAGVLLGNYAGTGWQQLATSSLGLLTTNVAEGSNLYYTNSRVQTYLDTINPGYFFSTTSANYFAEASTTIAKTYGSNLFIGTNAFSALTTFAGFISSASSTVGNGLQNGGLTISGGATTTGNAYFAGNVGIATNLPGKTLDVAGTARVSSTFTLTGNAACTGGQALQTNGSGDVTCGTITTAGVSTAGGWTTNNIGSVFLATTTDLVGIGATSTPYAKVSILSGNTSTTTLALVPALGATANIIDIYNTSGLLSSVFTAAGRLGLGTTTPGATLSVEGSSLLGNSATAGYFVATTSATNVLPYASSTALTVSGTGYFGAASTSVLTVSGAATFQSLVSTLLSTNASGLTQSTNVSAPLSFSGSTLSLNVGAGLTTSAGNLTLNLNSANNWQALQTFSGGASSTALSALNGVFAGSTATATLRGDGLSSTIPYASSTALTVSGTGYFGNLFATGSSTLQDVALRDLIGRSATTTSLFAATASSTNLFSQISSLGVATAATLSAGTTTLSNLSVTNTSTSTFAGGVAIGTSRFVVDSTTGNIGIGTAAPGKTLDVVGTARVSSVLTLTGSPNCTGQGALQTNSAGDVACGTVNLTGITTAGGWTTNNIGSVFIATSSDSVGIGATSTPYAKLSVLSSSAASTTFALAPISGQTANIIDIYNTSGVLASVLTAAGNLGLGTTNPVYTLDVSGTGHFTGLVDASYFAATSSTATSTFAGALGIGTTTLSQKFSLQGNAFISGNITNVANITATGTITSTADTANILPYASSTALTVSGTGYFGTATTTQLNANSATVGFITAGGLSISGAITSSANSATTLPYASSTALTVSGTAYLGTASTSNLTVSSFATNRVPYTTTGGVMTVGSGLTFDGTTLNANALSLSTALGISSGGTNASSFSTAGSAVYYDGTRLVTAGAGPVTIPFASTTVLTVSGNAYINDIIFAQGSTTLQNFTFNNATGTAATTTAFFSGVSSSTQLFAGTASIANLSLSNPLPVTSGGSGANSLTGLVVGNGTSPFTTVTDSLGLSSNINDETGSGLLVFNTNPIFSGNVGIGTSSPYASLSVAGASGVVANIVTATSTNGTSLFAGNLTIGLTASTSNLTVSSAPNSLLSTNSNGAAQTTSISGPLSFNGNTLSIFLASRSQNGYLSSADFGTFDDKISSTSLSGSGPITYNSASGAIGLNTAIANVFTGLQSFRTASSSLFSVTGTAYFGGTATTTIDSAGSLAVAGNFTGAGLTTCASTADKLVWTGGQFACASDQGAGGFVEQNWTFFNNSGLRLGTTTNQVIVGATATSSGVVPLAAFNVIGGAGIDFATTTALFSATASSTNLSVGNNAVVYGNLGLGSSSPSARLSVYGGNIIQAATGTPVIATSTISTGNTYASVIQGSYLYIADNAGGLKIYDNKNPTHMTLVGTYAGATGAVSLAVGGQYVYIGDTAAGLIVVDVSNPSAPVAVGSYAAGDVYGIALAGKYVYTTNYSGGGIRIIDVSNPSAPRLVGTYTGGGNPYGIAVQGRYAYIASQASPLLQIVDISNASAPSLVANLSAGFSFPTGIEVSGKYVYVADAGAGLKIVDVGNPSTPSIVGSYEAAHNYYGIAVAGNYAYVADHAGYVKVIDVTNPAAPFGAGILTLPIGAPLGISVSGKYAYVSNDDQGLSVLDINGIDSPAANIGALSAGSVNVSTDLSVGNNIYADGGLSVGGSGIFSRGTISAYLASTTQANATVANFMGGNVGVGTTTPYTQFATVGNGFFSGSLAAAAISATSTLTVTGLSTFASGFLSQASSTIGNGLQAGGLTISGGATTTGNAYFANKIGIGTPAPTYSLQVSGSADVLDTEAELVVSHTAGSSLAYGSNNKLFFGNDSYLTMAGTANYIENTNDNGVFSFRATGNNGAVALSAGNNGYISQSVAGYERVRLTSNGNLGVGTTSPWGALSITSQGTGAGIGFVVADSSNTPHFTVLDNGKVGIGTTSPFSKFAIHANSSDTNTTLFAVGSSTASARTTLFSISNTGAVTSASDITATLGNIIAGGIIQVQSRTKISAGAVDGNLLLYNNAGTSFDLLQLGGITSAFPALKRNGAGIDFRLADDSAYSSTTASVFNGVGNTASFFNFASSTAFTANNLFSTGATTTSLAITSIANSILKTLSNGSVVAAVAGTDYVNPAGLASAYPFSIAGNATSTLTQFNGGLTAYASTTIGSGTQTGGLTISGGATTTGNAYFSGNIGVGTTSPWAKFSIDSSNLGVSPVFAIGSTTGTQFVVGNGGQVGIGTSSPYAQLGVTKTASSPQLTLGYNDSVYTDFRTDATGNLWILPVGGATGGNVHLPNDNLYVCSGGTLNSNACPAGTLSDSGNVVVQNKVGIGTSTPNSKLTIAGTRPSIDISDTAGGPNLKHWLITSAGGNLYIGTTTDAYATTSTAALTLTNAGKVGIGTSTPTKQFSVSDLLYVGASGASGLGTATSTFQGDIKIIGKLDVSTIDPVYTIDGVKYATYGHSTIGIHEETVQTVMLAEKDESGKYSYQIQFDQLVKDSDLWLFYQVADFGEGWKDLVVNLTASFDGVPYYEKDTADNALIIRSVKPGEVSMRLIANRYDSAKWPNLRSDQDGNTEGTHIISTKSAQMQPAVGARLNQW